MELRNEDGSRAEMSGNGISCLAQAVVRAGLAPEGVVEVDTDAGPRAVTVVDTQASHRHRMRVAMGRSEEHTSELQSLMRISYAVFCLKKKNKKHSMIRH